MSKEDLREEKKKIRDAVRREAIEKKEREKQEKILEKERIKAEAKANRPKRKMNPEHLKKMQEARARSVAERRKAKELGQKLPTKKQVAFKEPAAPQEQMFTKDDLIKSQYQAIQMYDEKRKIDKAEKKAKLEEERKLAQSQQQIRRAIGQPDQNDIWSQALSGMF